MWSYTSIHPICLHDVDWDNLKFFTLQDLLLAKEEMMLQNIDGVTGTGRRCRIKMNVEKT